MLVSRIRAFFGKLSLADFDISDQPLIGSRQRARRAIWKVKCLEVLLVEVSPTSGYFLVEKLSHPRLAKVLASFKARDGRHFVVVEDVKGVSLRTYLDRALRISTNTALSVIVQVVDALSYLHNQGVAYCGLKHEHIMIVDFDRFEINLIDFDSCLKIPSEWFAAIPHIPFIGQYLAPGMADGVRYCPATVDTFSVGALIYRLFSGESALCQNNRLVVVNLSLLPQELKSLIYMCLTQYEVFEMSGVVRHLSSIGPFLRDPGAPTEAEPVAEAATLQLLTEDDFVKTDTLLGQGAQAKVFLGEMVSTGEPVALKCYTTKFNSVRLEWLHYIADIQHNHLIRLIGYYMLPDDMWVLAMEHVEGENLLTYINRQLQQRPPTFTPDEGPITEWAAVRILVQLADVVKYLHSKRIAHGDIQCDNIMLRGGVSDPIIVLIGGFDNVKKITSESPSHWDASGAPAYVAPEDRLGYVVDPFKKDIWTLGCVLCHMLCGFSPAVGETCLIPPIGNGQLRCLAGIMLNKKYENRPTASEVFIKAKKALPTVEPPEFSAESSTRGG